MTAGEEVVGDQAEVDVVHISFKWSHMLGCDEVDGGRLELQREQHNRKLIHGSPCVHVFLCPGVFRTCY